MLHIPKVLNGGEGLLQRLRRDGVKLESGGRCVELELECARVEVLARACLVLKGVKSGDGRGRN